VGLEQTVMQALGPRMKLPDSELGTDIIAGVVREIRRREKEGAQPYTKEQYVSDIGGYSWAGIDTSHGNLTEWFAKLSMDHGLQNSFLGKIQNWFADPKTKQFSKDLSFEDLMAPEDYNHIISEILRWVDIAAIGFTRVFPRDLEVDGIKFKKGDCWVIGFTGVHKNRNISPDPHNFNIDRFVPGKGPKGQIQHKQIIFGAGKRICGGYQLADVFLKLTCSVLASAFEFNMGSNWCDLQGQKIIRCREELNVNLRCRPEFWTTDDIVTEYGSL
jgi:cytochrome P450